MLKTQIVLFVCSGNFYRSRFAEALFNHLAEIGGLDWRANSKGFRPHFSGEDLSPEARSALTQRRIPFRHTRPRPSKLEEWDLAEAALTILLNTSEHRPKLEKAFPRWADRVRYWDIHDIDVEAAATAIPKLERNVLQLIAALEDGHAAGLQNSFALEF